ncbi:MAG TPA: hypothetical protein VHC97_18375 [Thermoanaerobaculia bacterium]|nr:hypothetical protein [Thermoanaerobaculia bacterium]
MGAAVVFLIALFAVLLLGASGVFQARRLRRAPESPRPPLPPPPRPPEPVDEAAELRRTITGSAELRGLYARLGFPPDVEEDCRRILDGLEGFVRTEIPDFDAFRAALSEAIEAQQGLAEGRFLTEEAELLREVAQAGENRDELIRLLDRAPVRRLLPVVERIPQVRNGERVWRTPVELSLLRKRPADPAAFEKLLDELDRLVRAGRPPRAEPLRADVLEALARVRRDARRENAYMPTSLKALEAAVDAWLLKAPPEARRRREELDALLLGMLRVRRGAGPREDARAQAKRYADSPWMHTPWITAYALTNLLDAELSSLPAEERGPSPSPRAATLRWVRDEVASSHFDGEETIRRLRQQEERELFVHSLVYALLRMSRVA